MRRPAVIVTGAAILLGFLAGCTPLIPPPVGEQNSTTKSLCDQLAADVEVKTDYEVSGNFKIDDTAVSGVHITVEGDEYSIETCTGSDGKWRVYPPTRSAFIVWLDGETLPEGLTLENTQDNVTVVGGDVRLESDLGLTGRRTVNFFFSRN